jgi:CheY-like chemotaxis protein
MDTAAGRSDAAGPAVRTRRILVVDDERDNAMTMAMLLQAYGHSPEVAHDGLQACERAAALQPEIILLDLGLPDLSGYDVCRRIRLQPWTTQPYIVALTGWSHEADRERTREAGFDLHLVKPVDPEELLRLLNERLAP